MTQPDPNDPLPTGEPETNDDPSAPAPGTPPIDEPFLPPQPPAAPPAAPPADEPEQVPPETPASAAKPGKLLPEPSPSIHPDVTTRVPDERTGYVPRDNIANKPDVAKG